jgi:raffinose/stachyose/melibiose transport system permease protein
MEPASMMKPLNALIASHASEERATKGWRPSYRAVMDLLFIAPALILFTALIMVPAVSGIFYSLTDWTGLNTPLHFIGIANFVALVRDPTIWTDIRTTVFFALLVTIGQNGLGLMLALALHTFRRSATPLRVLFLIPAMISPVAIGYIWSYIYSPLFGVLNAVLNNFHLSQFAHDWLGDYHTALYSVIFTNVWEFVGLSTIIFLAGLQTVPEELLEAAHLDGANTWQRFRFITFPLIAPAFTINIILTLIGSLKVFDLIIVMTEGGPGRATESVVLRIYEDAFINNSFAEASALSVVMFALILALSVINLRWLRRREVTI